MYFARKVLYEPDAPFSIVDVARSLTPAKKEA
jgi:hypothetical protein